MPEKVILIRFLNKQGYISDETVRKLVKHIPGVEYYLFGVRKKMTIREGMMNTEIDDEINLILDTLRDNKQIITREELSRATQIPVNRIIDYELVDLIQPIGQRTGHRHGYSLLLTKLLDKMFQACTIQS